MRLYALEPASCPIHIGMAKLTGGSVQRRRAWTMPANEAQALIDLISERVRSSGLEPRHRDTLIRLRAILEEDLDEDRDNEEGGGAHERGSVQHV